MASRDVRLELDPKVSVAPQSIGGAVNGTGVDLQGAEAALRIILNSGAATTPATVKIQESDDNSTFTDVADADLIGTTGNPAGVAQTASTIVKVSPTSAPSGTSASSRRRAPRRCSRLRSCGRTCATPARSLSRPPPSVARERPS
jgi:hypothetical protein